MVKNVYTVVHAFLGIVKGKIRLIFFLTSRKGLALVNRTAITAQILNSAPLMFLVSEGIVVFKMVKIVQTLISVHFPHVATQHVKQFQSVDSARRQINVKQILYVIMENVVF